MRKKQLPGFLLFAFLLLFVGSFGVHSDMLGKTLTSAIVVVKSDEPSKITAEEVVESQSRYHDLVETIRRHPQKLEPLAPSNVDSETLWLARCIYSETKRPEEMELVAWVVRNRVETGYRGRDSYREVVLDPFQFSAFNPDSRKRWFYANLEPDAQIRSWQRALTIAHRVRAAEAEYRPFSVQTRHFFSERSMIGHRHPTWAMGKQPVIPQRHFALDERRFRFYEGIS